MKSALTVIETRNHLNDKIHKIMEKIAEIKNGRKINELSRQERKEWGSLIALRVRYECYVTGLNFSLNEDAKIDYFSQHRGFESVKEFTCEDTETPTQIIYVGKKKVEIDWVDEEKTKLKNIMRNCQIDINKYDTEIKHIYYSSEGITLQSIQALEKQCGNKKENYSKIKLYKIRLEHLEKGLFKSRPEYLMSEIY